jgi:uncharacterized DUF497 family protein
MQRLSEVVKAFICSYNQIVLVWDEKKRRANLVKHKLDFADATLVYDNPDKLTRRSLRHGEERNADIAVIEITGIFLALVYVERGEDVRIISFRNASRKERKLYAEARKPN